MSKLIEAADFPVHVELKLSTNWKWEKYACMINAGITYSKENQESLDLNCGSFSYSDRVAEMKLEMFRVLNSNILNTLNGSSTVVIPAWPYDINESHEVKNDKTIILIHSSSDKNGVTDIVVKSSDGTTTYVVDTDYEVNTTDNVTTITILDWAISVWDTVIVEWTVELQETRKVIDILWTTADEKIDVRFVGVKEINGVDYHFSLEATEGVNTSAYTIEFLNKIKGGLPKGTEVTFKFDTNEVVMYDQISPAEEKL